MHSDLEVRIDGALVTSAQVEAWELRRVQAVLPKLRQILKLKAPPRGSLDGLASMRTELVRLKEQCGRQALRDALRGELFLSGLSTKMALWISGQRRKQCVTEITVPGCTAKHVADVIDGLMRHDTAAHRQSNLLACPDHYVLEPRGDTLEVIETTGGSPLPAQFFMRFDDESGVVTPRDPAYAHQSVGTARLSDGTVIGGVRHQFRDVEGGTLARLMVEFPTMTPQSMVQGHQWHLACEFSHWLREAKQTAERVI